MTWPNKVTYSRILLVPVFIIASLQVREHPAFKYVAIAIFVAIAVGDALDGYVARRFHMTSLEGKFIDPMADKLIMVSACILLALPIWGLDGGHAPLRSEIATVIVARDFLICLWVLITYLAGEKAVFEPTRLGRFTTFTQMLMIAVALVGTIETRLLATVAAPLSYAAALLTIGSGCQYLYKHARRMRSAGTPHRES